MDKLKFRRSGIRARVLALTMFFTLGASLVIAASNMHQMTTEWERTTGRLGAGERESIAHRVVNAAYEVIEGKGATNYAIGLAATRIIESVLRDERRVLPVSRMLAGWHGISGVCMAVPTVVGRDGAGTQLELPVSDDELAQLRASAEHIRAMSEGLGF